MPRPRTVQKGKYIRYQIWNERSIPVHGELKHNVLETASQSLTQITKRIRERVKSDKEGGISPTYFTISYTSD